MVEELLELFTSCIYLSKVRDASSVSLADTFSHWRRRLLSHSERNEMQSKNLKKCLCYPRDLTASGHPTGFDFAQDDNADGSQ